MDGENRNLRQILILAVGGALAIILAGVVLIGMITGNWPWNQGGLFDGYSGLPSYATEDSASTEDTTLPSVTEESMTTQTVPGTTGSSHSGSSGSSSGSGSNSGSGDEEIDFEELLDPTTTPTTAPTTGATEPTTAPTTKPTEKPTTPTTAPTTKPTEKPSEDVEVDIPLF